MAIQDYQKAQKLGEKLYRQALSHGEYPYLPVLEDLIRQNDIDGQLPMGQFEIPLSMIAGTAQKERTSAFAANFMPLLDYDSEFGAKWSALYDSVHEVGINVPIKVYEYMQRFYVIEGNKRVSVSRYNGAVAIEANVMRIIPKQTDTIEYQIYAEFMEFYRVAGIYEIQMSQPGAFPRLIQAITPTEQPDDPEEAPKQTPVWDEELRRDVKFMYTVFEAYYVNKTGGLRLPITVGDAFLHFLEIYGFDQLRGLTSVELHRRIDRIREEFRVLGSINPTSHILNPTEGSRKVPLTRKIPLPIPGASRPVLHIAFLYPKDPKESSWTYNHELGRLYLEDCFGDAITTMYYICTAEEAEATIAKAIEDGNKLIFTTSPVYHACTMRMAVAHPEVIMLNCSMNTAYKQLRTYYLRIYEAKFISGIIAGSMTESEHVGYIADYPVLGTPASIGAFALGVQLVNPRAKVFLDWSTLENHDPMEFFRANQVDLISDRDINAPVMEEASWGLYKAASMPDDEPWDVFNDSYTPIRSEENRSIYKEITTPITERASLYGLYENVPVPLAAPVWNWGSLYEDLVHSVLIGAWKNDGNENETQALNYYWGMSSGAIDIACSGRLPYGTQKLVRLVQDRITAGKLEPFTGVIYGQDRTCKVEMGQSLTPDEIIAADWLPYNVVGRLPEVSELAPQFREFAKWHTIRRSTV